MKSRQGSLVKSTYLSSDLPLNQGDSTMRLRSKTVSDPRGLVWILLSEWREPNCGDSRPSMTVARKPDEIVS
ncbi:hypothetical protein JTE90_013939 [Oedothorax gibbosus]|uniref:Uncharacterized protein n=1 Tax=Oedothorax gibbosus TaxID=931172 RepID=A0AAV6UAQ4_9ARAC|nr:hypothetical protein JTE90_013939 [Oedothorax gibbosus]